MSLVTSLGWERPDQRSPQSAVTNGEGTTDPAIRQIIQRQEALGSAAEALHADIQHLTRSMADHPRSPSAPPSLRIRELNAFRARTHEAGQGQGRRVWLGRALATTVIAATAAIGIVLLAPGGSSVAPAATVATALPNGTQPVPVAAEASVTSAIAAVAVVESDPQIAAPVSASPLTTPVIEADATSAAIDGEVQAPVVAPANASPLATTTGETLVPLYGSGIDILSILIERGNTVGIFARDYATTIDSIVIINNLADRDLIITGQYLDIAPGYNPALDDAAPTS